MAFAFSTVCRRWLRASLLAILDCCRLSTSRAVNFVAFFPVSLLVFAVVLSLRMMVRAALLVQLCALPAEPVSAQSATRPRVSKSTAPLLSQPQVATPNPFLPKSFVKQPTRLACKGYCVVSLVKEGNWSKGDAKLQATYDGQVYQFADARKLAIFAADPTTYAPVLSGDCVVSVSESKRRVPGALEEGIVYGDRLYFFANRQQREQFNAAPKKFRDADLVLAGNCPISQVDANQVIPGDSKTEFVLNGWRFRFLGVAQRNKFLANADRYRKVLGLPMPQGASEEPQENNSSQDSTARRIPVSHQVAAQGYCLVSLLDSGSWERGLDAHSLLHQGQKYLFATEQARTDFRNGPEKYQPACRGFCPVTLSEKNQRIAGSIHHPAEFRGMLYLLAGPEEKERFLTSPERYLSASPETTPRKPRTLNTNDESEQPYELTRKPSPAGRWNTQR